MDKVVLDACVLYPYTKRDLLLSVADAGCFEPVWSDDIHNEWSRNLIKNIPHITRANTDKTIRQMKDIFPNATQTGYKSLIPSLELKDKNDRHVLALAIHTKSKYIVTENTRHFPSQALSHHKVVAIKTDAFLLHIFSKLDELVIDAVKDMRNRLKNPPKTVDELLNMFKENDLKKFANSLELVKEKI